VRYEEIERVGSTDILPRPASNGAGSTTPAETPGEWLGRTTLICLSHLRWDFVYQRPQHLISRFAKHMPVFFIEEPVWGPVDSPRLELRAEPSGVAVGIPIMPEGKDIDVVAAQRALVDLIARPAGDNLALWYYTPMAREFTRHLRPKLCVYDCMDELSAFAGAPPQMQSNERELFAAADVVFTGGQTLYEAKRKQHANVHAFPSSVDVPHFAQARQGGSEPEDQASIPHPRVGFFGVVDERMDIDLLRGIAEARPDWHLVIIGPVVKIDPAILPTLPNIHYLGGKPYSELPRYLAGWDVALLPFANNESTRFISPTKTPEYLAAGRPVVSAPITDVVRPYGEQDLVAIASDSAGFVAAIEAALVRPDKAAWLARVDKFLSQLSWDRTWAGMARLMHEGALNGSSQSHDGGLAATNAFSLTQNNKKARHV
jgi:UDP-galactopyranose mutase